MQIYYINNAGGGFSGRKEIPDMQTVGQFFSYEFGSANPADYKITLNNITPTADRQMREGDTLVITPMNVGGNN